MDIFSTILLLTGICFQLFSIENVDGDCVRFELASPLTLENSGRFVTQY